MPSEREGVSLPPALVWIDAFSIGVPELDADHRQLVADAGAIVEAIRAMRPWHEVTAIAALMAQRCSAHFRREEALLESDGFGSLAPHRREHERIEAELQGVLGRIEGTGMPTRGMIEAALSFREMLIDHLLHYDLVYKSHVLDRRGL